ncbi:MAG: class I SAM-dependent methyltransferase [Gammaproteobacteria bacterium]|nr:class I SAM-dependent methyltransferase [Gammaproteobacteria bacterium]
MPTLKWLQEEFHYGYRSGNILSVFPSLQRLREERIVGGSYKKVFRQGLLPYLKTGDNVLELGPGAGSWSRAILKHIPNGKLTTVDFQEVSAWLKPEKYEDRLSCIKVEDNSFDAVENNCFDVFWSFGVLCHNNSSTILEILSNALPKMKSGGYAIHQYGDWVKLEKWGWANGKVPIEFKNKPDDEIWWPRNNQEKMCNIAINAGWEVVSSDLGLIERDSIILLRAK